MKSFKRCFSKAKIKEICSNSANSNRSKSCQQAKRKQCKR